MDLARYSRRFGGEGTIVTLDDGRALTAAHCLAAVDGRRGTVVASACGRRVWRVVRRWSPRGHDLALLQAIDGRPRPVAATFGTGQLARGVVLGPGVEIEFVGHDGRRFRLRRAVVTAVTATTAVADVQSRAGVCAGDSGGPVLVGGGWPGSSSRRQERPGPAVPRRNWCSPASTGYHGPVTDRAGGAARRWRSPEHQRTPSRHRGAWTT